MSGGIFQVFRWVPFKRCQDVLCIGNLFGGGVQGAWYDPSDLSTLFQDAAGTVPVTAMEHPVGRMLDLSGNVNHAVQATTTKRPVVSRRVNLLPSNNDSAWVKNTGVSFSVSGVGEVHPGSNVFKLSYNGSGSANTYRALVNADLSVISTSGAQYSTFVYLRADAPVTVRISGNTVVGPNTTVNVTTSWQKFSISGTGNGLGGIQFLIYSAVGDNAPLEVYLSSADTRLSIDDHLPYQWVNTATDYDDDSNKFPTYLRFDGVDDAYQTNSIDFTGTDKMTVVAGITKLSDAANGVVCEFGSPESVNFGTFSMWAPINLASTPLGVTAKGISRSVAAASAFYGVASGVVAQEVNLSAPSNALRLNGATLSTVTTALGGSFGNHPLAVGARAGGPLYFNGRLYSLIVRGAQTTPLHIEATELYIKHKMRMP